MAEIASTSNSTSKPTSKPTSSEPTRGQQDARKDQVRESCSRGTSQVETQPSNSSSIIHCEAIAKEQDRIATAFLQTQQRQAMSSTTHAKNCYSGNNFRQDTPVATMELSGPGLESVEIKHNFNSVSGNQDINLGGSWNPVILSAEASKNTVSLASSDGNTAKVFRNKEERPAAKRQRRC